VLSVLFKKIIKEGTLDVVWPDGSGSSFGGGEPHAAIRLHGRWTPLRIALNPELALGEAYMNGSLEPLSGNISDLLNVIMANLSGAAARPPLSMRIARRLRGWRRRLGQFNFRRRARRNAAHHYDLRGEFFALFLDEDRQYSCAYFEEPQMSLEAAQRGKKDHIIAKLNLDRPGLKVLEIGSGWGGLALDIARKHAAEVLSVTLSTEQLEVCRERARAARLDQRCRFELRDYRAVSGRFDRVVSIAMFEAVGVNHFDGFFRKAAEVLDDRGVMLLHTIGRSETPGATNPWLDKYIFPGSHAPSLSEILPAIERSGLKVTDVEVLRIHYADTLKAWRERFRANWSKAAAIYDERFCRMWDFYLAGCEITFRLGDHVIFQIQLAKRVDSLPITRDYMQRAERALKAA
jgi:cyclopropane-fatty-acyl-phospholipid synthase